MLHDAFIAHSSFRETELCQQPLAVNTAALQGKAVAVDIVVIQTAAAAVVESMV